MSETVTLKQLQTIIDMQARLADAALDLDMFMQEVVDAAERLTDAKGAVIELVDGEDMVYSCASAPLAAFIGMRLKREGSLSGRCVDERRVLRCDDTETDRRVDREACRKIGVRSMVCTPLFHGGEPVGVLKIMSSEPSRFDHFAVQTLRLIAGALGAALGKQLAFQAKNEIETELRKSRARLEQSEARMRTLLLHANDAIFSLDSRGRLIEWNHTADQMFAWNERGAAGKEFAELVMPVLLQGEFRAELEGFLTTGLSSWMNNRIELDVVDRNGSSLDVELSLSAVRVDERWEFLGLLHDISDRKRFEQRLQQFALEDGLTGLANRRALIEATERTLLRAKRHGHRFALLYMDLNGFKAINDTHGHEVGDRALKEFADRVRRCVRGSDLVARLGGDEFAILAEEVSTDAEVEALKRKILAALETPMKNPTVQLSTSVGVAIFNQQRNVEEIIREADASMYDAKRRMREAERNAAVG